VKWIQAAGFIPAEEAPQEEVAKTLAERFELFYMLSPNGPTWDELNGMTMTELHACSLAKAAHDSRFANLIRERQIEQQLQAVCDNAVNVVSVRLNEGAPR